MCLMLLDRDFSYFFFHYSIRFSVSNESICCQKDRNDWRAFEYTRRFATWNSNDSFFYRPSYEWMNKIFEATNMKEVIFNYFIYENNFRTPYKGALMHNKWLTSKIGFIHFSTTDFSSTECTARIQKIIIWQSKWHSVPTRLLLFNIVLFKKPI